MVFKDEFLKNNIIMFFSISLINIANFLYQIFVVRNLSIENYGSFNSLLSIFVIFSLPISSVSTMAAKFTSSYNSVGEKRSAERFLYIISRHMLCFGIITVAVYFIFAQKIKICLKLDSIYSVYLTGGMLFLSMVSTVIQGGLQGFEDFVWLSAANILSAVLKLFFAFWFIYIGWNLLGALGSFMMAQIVALLVGFIPLRNVFFENNNSSNNNVTIDLKEKYKFILPSFVTFGCIGLLLNTDVVLVKYFFNSADAGNYSIAQMVGKIILFVSSAVSFVMLPAVSGLSAQKKESRHLLRKGLLFAAFLCLTALAVYNLYPRFILNILCGRSDDDIILLGRLFSVIMAFYSLDMVLCIYQLSMSRFVFLRSLIICTLLQLGGILLFHQNLKQILYILLFNSVLLFILNLKTSLTKSNGE